VWLICNSKASQKPKEKPLQNAARLSNTLYVGRTILTKPDGNLGYRKKFLMLTSNLKESKNKLCKYAHLLIVGLYIIN